MNRSTRIAEFLPEGKERGSKEQLYNEAKKLGIDGRSKMNKSQLLRSVNAKRC